MNQEQQPQGRIEQYGNQRFMFEGDRTVAAEQTCFQCHQTYWYPIVPHSSKLQMSYIHQCKTSPQSGASVIDKFG